MSSFFDTFKYLFAINGVYKKRIYLPKTEPTTPITITSHTFKLNINCNNNIIVNAGKKGNGAMSNNKAPIKTNKYCHHILLYFIFF